MGDAMNPSFSLVFREIEQVQFLLIFLIILISSILLILVKRLLPKIADIVPGRFRFYILAFVPVLRLMILILTIFIVIPLIIKPTVQNFVAVFLSAGFALAFAFRDYISSLIAGVVVIYEKPYRQGDWVQIDGAYGEIKHMGLRALQLITPDDTIVTIPHSKIWNSNIYNANFGQREHMCIADFYLHPDHDAALIRQKLIDVIMTSPYLQLNLPFTVVVSEKPLGTHYRLKAYPLDNKDEFQFISDLTVRGKAALAEVGARAVQSPVSVHSEG